MALIRTRDPDDTAETLMSCTKREGGERRERKAQSKKSYRSSREEQEYVLAAFPQRRFKECALLLEHFGSLKAVIEAEPGELMAVDGIGEKTASAIWDLMVVASWFWAPFTPFSPCRTPSSAIREPDGDGRTPGSPSR